jgi:hypothetical protein
MGAATISKLRRVTAVPCARGEKSNPPFLRKAHARARVRDSGDSRRVSQHAFSYPLSSGRVPLSLGLVPRPSSHPSLPLFLGSTRPRNVCPITYAGPSSRVFLLVGRPSRSPGTFPGLRRRPAQNIRF